MTDATRILRLLQITDPHLYADPEGRLKGLVTDATLRSVINHARQHEPVDLVLATGDLVHDGSVAGYQRLRQHYETLGSPVYCLPGNHDDGPVLSTELNQGLMHTRRALHLGDWLLVFLDSSVPGTAAGHLAEEEFEALEDALNATGAAHALICVHHNPVPVGSAWLDTMTIDNGERLVHLCSRHPRARGILFGHIHQVFDHVRDDVRLLGTPSTCIQFQTGSDTFTLAAIPPGYRTLELHPDGRIESTVHRLDDVPEGLDLGPEGY